MLEIANEPVHPSQSAEVHKPEVLEALADRLAPDIPVALGSIERGDGFGDGRLHHVALRRASRGAAGGRTCSRWLQGADLLARWKKPVISDEPIGAGAGVSAGASRRCCRRGFAPPALLTRLAGLGATFHYEAGLQARVPDGRELECFNAWNEAWTLLPADVEHLGVFRERRDAAGSIVTAFDRDRNPGDLRTRRRREQGGFSSSGTRPRR